MGPVTDNVEKYWRGFECYADIVYELNVLLWIHRNAYWYLVENKTKNNWKISTISIMKCKGEIFPSQPVHLQWTNLFRIYHRFSYIFLRTCLFSSTASVTRGILFPGIFCFWGQVGPTVRKLLVYRKKMKQIINSFHMRSHICRHSKAFETGAIQISKNLICRNGAAITELKPIQKKNFHKLWQLEKLSM